MILVTGSEGFIGKHLVKALKETGKEIVYLDTVLGDDVKSTKTIDRYFTKPIECVVHLAGCAGVRPSITNPYKYIKNNIFGTTVLLEAMKRHGVKNIVFASSSSVYGDVKSASKETDAKHPASQYAWSKSAVEDLIKLYTELYDMNAVCLRFYTVFGEHQRKDLAIQKFIDKIKAGEPIEVYGDGTQARSFTYVGDIVDGILKSMEYVKDHKFDIFNLGGDNPVSVNEIIEVLKELMGDFNIIYKEKQLGDVFETYSDNSKAKEILKWSPKTSLKDGIEKQINA